MVESNHKMSGEEYFRRFLQGDELAFEHLVSLYREELTLYIKSIIYSPDYDSDEAEYLMIEAFARLAAGGSRFAGRSSLKTYLFAIGKNLARRHLKSRARVNSVPIDGVEEVITKLYASETPEDAALRSEDSRRLYAAVNSLKKDQRAVIINLYINDMSYNETASVMKKNVRQIEGLAARAKAALRRKLEER